MRLRTPTAMRDAMDSAGMSCAKLAEKVGCSKAMIGHLRVGKYRTRPELATRIEVALSVPLGSLFEPVVDEDAA